MTVIIFKNTLNLKNIFKMTLRFSYLRLIVRSIYAIGPLFSRCYLWRRVHRSAQPPPPAAVRWWPPGAWPRPRWCPAGPPPQRRRERRPHTPTASCSDYKQPSHGATHLASIAVISSKTVLSL